MGLNADDRDLRTQELDNMIQQNAQELETKRRDLYETRIDIEKSHGIGSFAPKKLNTQQNAYPVKPPRRNK